MSKRKLLQLVNEKHVQGWDDPRMPTISAFRRRGFTPESIHAFCEKIGVARRDNLIDVGLLEFCVREHLNKTAYRVMGVLDPVKLIITNFPSDTVEEMQAENLPDAPTNTRNMPFTKELWIEREDFMEVPEKKWFRLAPGKMVRLKHAYIIECTGFEKDTQGKIGEIHATYVPDSRSGNDTSGIAVKGTIHWVSAKHALDAEVRLYDRLFTSEDPLSEEGDFKDHINPDSLQTIQAKVEPSLYDAHRDQKFQFLRKGYFCLDKDSTKDKMVFNRTVSLKDTWVKEKGK